MINLYIRNCKFIILNLIYAQRARGKLIREVEKSFTVDVFVGNVTDGEKVCMGNLVGSRASGSDRFQEHIRTTNQQLPEKDNDQCWNLCSTGT